MTNLLAKLRVLPAAISLGLAVYGTCANAQATTDAHGAWQIEAPFDAGKPQDRLSLTTHAIGRQDATLSLICNEELPFYYFAVRDSRLADLASGDDIAIVVRVANQVPAIFLVASRGDGSVPVKERVHQTAFSVILSQFVQAGANAVEFKIANHEWTFSLDGFPALTKTFMERCGYPVR
jgi:hypothetical protein